MGVNLSGLEHFKNTLADVKRNISSSKKNPKIKRIIDISMDEIKKAYSGKKVSVIVKKSENGFTIYVKDTQAKPTIAFDEFGTGFYAKGSYPGKLPTQTITFEVGKIGHRRTMSTKGWEYYYGNPYDTSVKQKSPAKVIHGGVYGWMTPNGLFHVGQMPSKRMYNACKRIKERLRSENL